MKKALALFVSLMLLFVCVASAQAVDYSSDIRSIHSSFVSGDNRASSAVQQQVTALTAVWNCWK
ncbi:MAG: hypothetical protein CW338_07240 [Clostridiales bacterium]|nr:hypothetical protein [Clostridiales bacterium]